MTRLGFLPRDFQLIITDSKSKIAINILIAREIYWNLREENTDESVCVIEMRGLRRERDKQGM